MKSALIIITNLVLGVAIIASAFCSTAILVGWLCLLWADRTAPHDGQSGIGAAILGLAAGIPAALTAGYFWLISFLNRLERIGVIAKPHTRSSN